MVSAATAIAEAVAIQAVADGVASPQSADLLIQAIRARRWTPTYPD